MDEAEVAYRRALELNPGLAEAHFNLSMLLLQQGNYEQGWVEHEWRWKCKDLRRAPVEAAAVEWLVCRRDRIAPYGSRSWGHSAIRALRSTGKAARWQGGVVVPEKFDSPAEPMPRHRRIHSARLAAAGLSTPEAHLTSLPLALGTTLETVPPESPYLFAAPELVEQWRGLPAAEIKVGIGWQGNPDFKQDKTRSIPLAEFAPLAKVAPVQLISLQKGHGTEQLLGVKDRFSVSELPPDVDQSAGAFADTAGVMMNLDLVITSDTAMRTSGGRTGRAGVGGSVD